MKNILLIAGFLFFAQLPLVASAEGFCIRLKDGKLVSKPTSGSTCPKKQAFIPTVAGPTGATGATGPAGSSRGYGAVSSAGNLDATRSSDNVSVRKVATGVYCLSAGDVEEGTVFPIVSADQDDGLGSFHLAQIKTLYGSTFGCTSSEWAVSTSRFSAGDFLAADVGFTFLIP